MSANHFLLYCARMQDAGVASLWVSLGAMKGFRVMHVSADMSNGDALVKRFPTRTFHLDGTDPVLARIEEELVYEGDGVSQERLDAAIAAHPQYADDLRDWGAMWLASGGGNDLETEEMDEQDASGEPFSADSLVSKAKDHMQFVKGLMRGLDSNRESSAKKSA